jgi:hypothetical protein
LRLALMVIGLGASEGKFNPHFLFEWYRLPSISNPHAADMGRVESEQAVVRYPPDPFQPWFGFSFRNDGSIYELRHMHVRFTFRP